MVNAGTSAGTSSQIQLDDLVARERWPELASALAAAGSGTAPERTAADAVLAGVLATGRVEHLRNALTEVGDKALLLRLLEADAGIRIRAVELHDLDDLVRACEQEPDRPDLTAWAHALRAEYFLWQGDMTGLVVAMVVLSSRPERDGADATPWGVLGLARLERMRTVQGLLGFEAVFDAAGIDGDPIEPETALSAAGWHEEAAVTCGFVNAVRGMLQKDPAQHSADVAAEVTDRLEALGSDRWPLAAFVQGWLAVVNLDPSPVAAEAVARYRAADEWRQSVVPAVAVDLLDLVTRLRSEEPSPELIDALVAAATELRDLTPLAAGLLIVIAGIVADAGDGRATRRVASTLITTTPVPVAARVGLELLHARCEVLETGADTALGTARDLLGPFAECYGETSTAVEELRLAVDCARAGRSADAHALATHALAVLPSPPRRTWREAYYAERVAKLPAAQRLHATGAERDTVVTLAPRICVRRAGLTHVVEDKAGHLLALLVAARRPVTTDWVLEALWPDDDPTASRARLASVLWRLRTRFGLATNELIVRDRAGLRLELGDKWDVDAWSFWDEVVDSTRRNAALAEYRHDFCAEQYPDDETVAAYRERLSEAAGAAARHP